MPDVGLVAQEKTQSLATELSSAMATQDNLYDKAIKTQAHGFTNDDDVNAFNAIVDQYNDVSQKVSELATNFNSQFDEYSALKNQYKEGVDLVQVKDPLTGLISSSPLFKTDKTTLATYAVVGMLVLLIYWEEFKI